MKEPVFLNKYIFEIRYSPLISVFDKRGEILKNIWKPFEAKAKQWQVENVAVHIKDTMDNPSRYIYVSHLRAFIAYETPDTEEEFNNDAKKFLKCLIQTFPEIELLQRAGYRHVCFKGGAGEIDKYFSSIQPWLTSPLPTTLPIDDAAVVLGHSNGRIAFGSTKPTDGFLEKEFPNFEDAGEPNGLYIDVDSWAKDINLDKPAHLGSVFSAVQETTKATAKEIQQSLRW